MNGPALAAERSQVAAAWFTRGANEQPRVLLSRSRDAGRSFEKPLVVSDRNPVGRVDVAILDDKSIVVSWLESIGRGTAELRVRRFDVTGSPQDPVTVAEVSSRRSSGFPRLGRSGDGALLAWTDPQAGPKVFAALLDLQPVK